MCIVETLMAGLTFKDAMLPILGHFHYCNLRTHLSIFVPLFIIHKSHKDLATRLKATKNNSPDSFDVHPGTTILRRRHKLFKNSRFTCALTDGSFFSAIIYWISSSIFWTFRLETESTKPIHDLVHFFLMQIESWVMYLSSFTGFTFLLANNIHIVVAIPAVAITLVLVNNLLYCGAMSRFILITYTTYL